MLQAIGATRPGGHVGYVGVTHGALPGRTCSSATSISTAVPRPYAGSSPTSSSASRTGASTRAGFDLTLPLDEAAEGYRAMDERRAIKTLLTV
jgi:threonine dehydrogenase-like Zn-dependent dehydrogenase